MRKPSDRVAAWEWWRQALDAMPADVPADPQCGLYKTRRSDRTWAAASIDLDQHIDFETGELTEPEQLLCFVDGRARDADEAWLFLAKHPISEAEHERLRRQPRVTDLSKEVVV